MKAVVWDEEGLGAKYHDEEIPADLQGQGRGIPPLPGRDRGRARRRRHGRPTSTATSPTIDTLKRLHPQGGQAIDVRAGPVRLGVQEQGRAAAARRGGRLSAVAGRHPGGIKGIDVDTGAEVVRMPTDDEPFAVLAFKIMDDPFVGTLTFCRVYSGKVETGASMLNSTKDRRERVGRMLLMHANNREDIKEAYAGDIVALAGLKDTRTGDTLCDPQQAGDPREDGIPRSGHRDRDRAEVEGRPGEARRRAGEARRRGPVVPRLDRPGVRPDHPQGHGRAASRHQGRHPEAHLQGRRQHRRAAGRLSRDASTEAAEIDYTHKKQTGGSGQFARVKIVFEPAEPGAGFDVRDRRSSAARCRRNTSPASRRASTAVMGSGVLAGFPVVDVKATLIDGAYHDVDSSALAFEIAARAAFREGLQKGGSVLLEPIMKVEVVTPEEYTGYVIGDLQSRRGQVQGQDMRANARGHQRDGAARQHVRLRQPVALRHAGPRQLHHAVRSLRAGSREHRRRRSSRSSSELDASRADRQLGITQKEPGYGQGKIRAYQAALQHRHDRSRRPRQDDADGGDHQGAGEDRRRDVHGLRPDRQGAGREGARHHDLHRARRVRDARSATTRTSTAPATPTT